QRKQQVLRSGSRFRKVRGRSRMAKRFCVLVALLMIVCSSAPFATGQNVQNVRSVLDAANVAMGGDNLKTIEYSGAGWSSRIGQTYGLNEDWPKFEVAGYTRAIDYAARWSREDYTRRQGNYPTLGGTPMAQQHVT